MPLGVARVPRGARDAPAGCVSAFRAIRASERPLWTVEGAEDLAHFSQIARYRLAASRPREVEESGGATALLRSGHRGDAVEPGQRRMDGDHRGGGGSIGRRASRLATSRTGLGRAEGQLLSSAPPFSHTAVAHVVASAGADGVT